MFKSIKFRFTLVYSILIVAIVVFLSVVFFTMFAGVVANNQINTKLDLVYSFASDLDSDFMAHTAALESEALRVAWYHDYEESLVEHLKILKDSYYYYFANIVYKDLEGQIISSDGPMYSNDDHLTGNYFEEPIMSGPYFEDDLPMMMISLPVFDYNGYIGKLTGYIDLNLLSESYKGFESYLGEGIALFNEDLDWIIDSRMPIQEAINLREVDLSNNKDFDLVIISLEADYEGFIEYSDKKNDESYIFTFSTLANSPNWKLGMFTKTEHVFQDLIEYAEFFATAVILIIFVTLIITRLLTGRTIQPIVVLTEAVKKGELAVVSNKVLRRDDEINSLYTSYNTMTRSLLRHSNELENLVEERTKALHEANERLYSLATTDSLTGAMNRMQIIDQMENIIYNIQHLEHGTFSILFIDLDNFKYYNDTFGHDIGDLMLVEMIKFFNNHIRSNDYLGRYGGDEFIIVYPHMPKDNLSNVVSKLVIAMNEKNGYQKELSEWIEKDIFIPDEKKLALSIGTATYESGSSDTVDDLIKRADETMYQMKLKRKTISNDMVRS